ncbi:hypothetical protein ACT3SZ_03615 [Corynebacterium sp. AOP40-9SA-29]|uniref:hypothetical protein n=1 Tax=Corynebacterium sp. AOP40-9SA-29 TaxID=3457677 RepID=UPI00403315D6
MRSRRTALGALAVLVTVPLTACGEDAEPAAETTTETSALTIDAAGRGPIALSTSNGADGVEGTDGTAESIDGRLVTGQGSCFAIVDGSTDQAPRPVVFPTGTESVTEQGRPSVTPPGQDTVYVGEPISVEAVSVQLEDLDGLPEQCATGGSTTGLVVR